MASTRKHELLSGAFVLMAIIVFAMLAISGGDWKSLPGIRNIFKDDRLRCVAYFDTIKALTNGAPVKVGGHAVGEVIGLSIEQRSPSDADSQGKPRHVAVRVEFLLERSDSLRFARGVGEGAMTTVKVERDGFLGTDYLALIPGGWGETSPNHAQPLKSVNEMIATEGGEAEILANPGADLSALIEKAGPLIDSMEALLEETRGVVRKLDRSLDPDGPVASMLDNLSKTVTDADRVLVRVLELMDPETSADRGGLYPKIVDPLNTLLVNADGTLTELGLKAKSALVEAEGRFVEAKSLVKNVDGAVSDARNSLKEADPKLQEILTNVRDTTARLDQRLNEITAQIRQVTDETTGLLKDTRGLVSQAQPDLLVSLSRLRRSMWEVEMLSRKIRANPAVLLFGDEEKPLEAISADATRIRQAGKAPPFQQREER